jgi:hypothetical protein
VEEKIMSEFKLTKKHRALKNAASKDTSRPTLHCIHITKGKVQAADGFIAMERGLDYDGDEDFLLNVDDITGHQDAKMMGGVVYVKQDDGSMRVIGKGINIIKPVEGNYPNIDNLYPTTEPVFKIGISRTLLQQMLNCLDKDETAIKFIFYGENSPVKIIAGPFDSKNTVPQLLPNDGDSVQGLIMPMKVQW